MSFAMHVGFREDVAVQVLDGEAVVLNLTTGRYYGLDDVATRMWEVLAGAPSIAAAYERLRGEFEVEPERLRSDLLGLIGELVRHGLVEVRA